MTLMNRKASKFPEKFDFYRLFLNVFVWFFCLFFPEVMPGPSGGKSLFISFNLTKRSFKAKISTRDLHVRTNILKSMIAWYCVSFQYIAQSLFYEDPREKNSIWSQE